MSEIKIACPHCGQNIICDDSYVGMEISCPNCQQFIKVVSSVVPTAQVPGSTQVAAHDVFISYRRDGGEHLASRVKDALRARSYSTFMDVEDLKGGKFNTALLEKIEQATDVVVICTPNCLERCQNGDDWLRQEIRHAIRTGKNIVPLMARGFEMPPAASLPPDMAEFVNFQGLAPAHDLFEASMDKLASSCLKSKPALPANVKLRSIVAGLIAGFRNHTGIGDDTVRHQPRFSKKNPPLAEADLVTLLVAFVLNLVIVIGAGLSYGQNRVGFRLVRWTAITMLVTNTICCIWVMEVAKKHPMPGQANAGYVFTVISWLVAAAPMVLIYSLFRRVK